MPINPRFAVRQSPSELADVAPSRPSRVLWCWARGPRLQHPGGMACAAAALDLLARALGGYCRDRARPANVLRDNRSRSLERSNRSWRCEVTHLMAPKEHLNKQMAIVTKLVGHRQERLGRQAVRRPGCWGQLLRSWVPLHKLGRRYACCHRNRCRRAINRLANAQVTTRRWVFFASPR
jgi:hypothetical protein